MVSALFQKRKKRENIKKIVELKICPRLRWKSVQLCCATYLDRFSTKKMVFSFFWKSHSPCKKKNIFENKNNKKKTFGRIFNSKKAIFGQLFNSTAYIYICVCVCVFVNVFAFRIWIHLRVITGAIVTTRTPYLNTPRIADCMSFTTHHGKF